MKLVNIFLFDSPIIILSDLGKLTTMIFLLWTLTWMYECWFFVCCRALVSYPGSGNSWLRYLLDGCTGVFTGSIFKDRSLSAAGLLGEDREPNDGSTIVQKTHHDTVSVDLRTRQKFAKLTELMFGYRGILLIRNPYDAIRSHWNFLHTLDHKGHAGPKQFSLRSKSSFNLLLTIHKTQTVITRL